MNGVTDALQRLAQSTLLIDDYGGTYRYHTLLREFLRGELAVREPQRVATLHRRAATWYQANQALEPAIDHAFAAGDLELAAALVGNGFGLYHWSGRRATIRAWAMRFGAAALGARPWLAVLAAWEEMAAGDVGRRRCATRTSPSVERSRAGRRTAQPPSRPAARCSGPPWPARAPRMRSRMQPGRSNSRGTPAPGGTSRSGNWPSRASRWAIGMAQTRPLPRRSSLPGLRGHERDLLRGARAPRPRGRRAGRLGRRHCPRRGERRDRSGTPSRGVLLERPVSRRANRD